LTFDLFLTFNYKHSHTDLFLLFLLSDKFSNISLVQASDLFIPENTRKLCISFNKLQ